MCCMFLRDYSGGSDLHGLQEVLAKALTECEARHLSMLGNYDFVFHALCKFGSMMVIAFRMFDIAVSRSSVFLLHLIFIEFCAESSVTVIFAIGVNLSDVNAKPM